MPVRPIESPELELLLQCARLQLDDARIQRISHLLTCDLDWDSLVPKARRHGLIPLMHRHFSAMGGEGVPPAVLQRVKALAENYRVHNLMLVSELLAALKAFESAGLTVLPYKGPALAAFLYGDLALRHITDIDLLAHPRDAVRAREILLDQGYLAVPPRSRRMSAMMVPFHYEFAFTSKLGTIVELTWRMGAAYWRLPQIADAAWGRLERLSFAGHSVPWLAPEDLLTILCLHGCKHKWDTLKWLVDIAEMVRAHPGLDWKRVMEEARETGAGRVLTLSLLLAHEVLDAPLPQEVREAAQRTPSLVPLVREVWDQLGAVHNRQVDTLESLDFMARLATRADTRIACRVLPVPYLLRHRLVLPALAALRPARRKDSAA